MSLLLSHLKTYDMKTKQNDRTAISTKATSESSQTSDTSIGRELIKGEIIKGEIIDLRSDQATIKLSDGSIVQGRMDLDVELFIGQNATFEVASDTGKNLQLKLVVNQEQSKADQLICKALIQAGLPVNAKNREIVNALLDANLSIDKQSIMKFLKVLYQHPNANLKDLVFLQKHGIAMNETNLQQVKEYHSSEHRIVAQLQSLATNLSELLSEPMDEATGLKLLHMAIGTEENVNQLENKEIVGQEDVRQLEHPHVAGKEVTSQLEYPEVAGKEDTSQFANKNISSKEDSSQFVNPEVSARGNMSQIRPYLSKFPMPIQQKLVADLKQFGVPEEVLVKVEEGSISGNELLKVVYHLTHEKENLKALPTLMKDEIMQSILQDQFFQKYTLSPKQLAKEGGVKEFYLKVEEDLEQLKRLLHITESNSSTEKVNGQVEQLKNNIDFMKTLNEIYPYIQLPVRLKEKNIHSELFVFTKRKGKLTNTEQIKLLLHLDMDSLGPLDIHLTLNQSNLNAKFYIQDDKVQALFETTIGELEHVLSEKGYHLYSEFHQQEKESNALHEVSLMEQESEGVGIRRYTFDIRA